MRIASLAVSLFTFALTSCITPAFEGSIKPPVVARIAIEPRASTTAGSSNYILPAPVTELDLRAPARRQPHQGLEARPRHRNRPHRWQGAHPPHRRPRRCARPSFTMPRRLSRPAHGLRAVLALRRWRPAGLHWPLLRLPRRMRRQTRPGRSCSTRTRRDHPRRRRSLQGPGRLDRHRRRPQRLCRRDRAGRNAGLPRRHRHGPAAPRSARSSQQTFPASCTSSPIAWAPCPNVRCCSPPTTSGRRMVGADRAARCPDRSSCISTARHGRRRWPSPASAPTSPGTSPTKPRISTSTRSISTPTTASWIHEGGAEAFAAIAMRAQGQAAGSRRPHRRLRQDLPRKACRPLHPRRAERRRIRSRLCLRPADQSRPRRRTAPRQRRHPTACSPSGATIATSVEGPLTDRRKISTPPSPRSAMPCHRRLRPRERSMRPPRPAPAETASGRPAPAAARRRRRFGLYWIYVGLLAIASIFYLAVVSPIIRPTLPTIPNTCCSASSPASPSRTRPPTPSTTSPASGSRTISAARRRRAEVQRAQAAARRHQGPVVAPHGRARHRA